jgi:hypothetical protein
MHANRCFLGTLAWQKKSTLDILARTRNINTTCDVGGSFERVPTGFVAERVGGLA